MQRKLKGIATIAALLLAMALSGQTLKVEYKFDKLTDESNTYTGALMNGATLSTISSIPVLSLGSANGYFDFGSNFGQVIGSIGDAFTITVNVYLPVSTNLTKAGNFIYNFANGSSTGYIFFGANTTKYAITATSYNAESGPVMGTAFPKGEWVQLTYTQSAGTGNIYLNGVLKKSGAVKMTPSQLGSTTKNWLGRSCYSNDAYLAGAMYNDLRIYDGTISETDINALCTSVNTLNTTIYANQLETAKTALTLSQTKNLTTNLTLPATADNDVIISWSSSNEAVITSKGIITRPTQSEEPAQATLTATLSKGGQKVTKSFDITVKPYLNDKDAVNFDLGNIVLKGGLSNLHSDLTLPTTTVEGSILMWKSSDESYLTNAGTMRKLPENAPLSLTLTATARKGQVIGTRNFSITLAQKEPYTNYLFAFFPSNSNEQLYYALSNDGYNYTTLNNGTRVLYSDSIAIKKAIRDPHVLRGQDGNTFYMVATDMKSSEGWSSNRGIVMMKSTDLIHWQHSTVNFPTRFPDTWAGVTRVWAPETIWDATYKNTDGTYGRYMIYFSLLTNDGKLSYDKVFYCYANDDFTDLLTEPTFLYDRGSATIDADIIYNYADSLYHMFYKNEGAGGICEVTSHTLTATDGSAPGSQWSAPSATLQQTTVAVEGVGVFRKINEDNYIMMYDCYGNGYYQFCSSSDLYNFTLMAQTNTSGSFTPRHGTVIPITNAETQALMAAFPTSGLGAVPLGARNPNVKTNNMEISTSAHTIYLPVRYGTDLTNFDPQLYATAGAIIEPQGPQDFTTGAKTYTFTNTGATQTYNITAEVCVNPVIPDFHADPEVLFSHKTGRFYIYPTTDGLSGWAGHTFDVYSSADLTLWQNEGTILDLATDDVTWATGNAWAPCIEEKWMNGAYKYFFYFSGQNPTYGYKTLGYATSDSPTGPFTADTLPMVTSSPASGQIIDSDVFTDPQSGKTYYYWGNGNMVCSLLSDDMTSYSDAKTITPSGGTTATWAFREGTYVFYRDGKYYFLWSVDDTGSTNYHVAYGTSTSPTGPITVATNPIVIIQDASNGIYGTGHNSILQIPDRDEWYIVYHRINKAYLNNGPGYHREVCIDKLEFNSDGTIKQVTPTKKGIEHVDISDYISSTLTTVHNNTSMSSATVAVRKFYSINGLYLGTTTPSRKGIYIVVSIMNDGSRKVNKIMK